MVTEVVLATIIGLSALLGINGAYENVMPSDAKYMQEFGLFAELNNLPDSDGIFNELVSIKDISLSDLEKVLGNAGYTCVFKPKECKIEKDGVVYVDSREK